MKRLEDPGLLTGQGRYLDDIRLPGLLHAAFVRSPHAHARLAGVDASAALAVPGVVAVLTGRDLAGRVQPLSPRLDADGFAATAWPALADSRVRFVGEPVAVVAAGTPYAAVDGCERVAVGYEPLPALADVDAALAPDAPVLHETVPGNVLVRRRFSQGDVDAAFAGAAVRIRERFGHGRCSAVPLEPRGIVAHWEGDHLTVWTGTQIPFVYRTALARSLRASGEPRAGDRAGHGRRLRPEDARDARGPRRGRDSRGPSPDRSSGPRPRRENLQAASHAREGRLEVEAAADADGRRCSGFARACSRTPAPTTSTR